MYILSNENTKCKIITVTINGVKWALCNENPANTIIMGCVLAIGYIIRSINANCLDYLYIDFLFTI